MDTSKSNTVLDDMNRRHFFFLSNLLRYVIVSESDINAGNPHAL